MHRYSGSFKVRCATSNGDGGYRRMSFMKYGFLVETYETERIKVVSVWSEFRDEELSFRPRLGRPARTQFPRADAASMHQRGHFVSHHARHRCERAALAEAGDATGPHPPHGERRDRGQARWMGVLSIHGAAEMHQRHKNLLVM